MTRPKIIVVVVPGYDPRPLVQQLEGQGYRVTMVHEDETNPYPSADRITILDGHHRASALERLAKVLDRTLEVQIDEPAPQKVAQERRRKLLGPKKGRW